MGFSGYLASVVSGAEAASHKRETTIEHEGAKQHTREEKNVSNEISKLESELNEMTAKGKNLDALARYYAEDCTFEEGDGSKRTNRKAQHDHLSRFFASLKKFNDATLHGQATGDDVSMSEWTFDMTGGDGKPIVWNEVLVRRWKGNQVIAERFYTAQSPR